MFKFVIKSGSRVTLAYSFLWHSFLSVFAILATLSRSDVFLFYVETHVFVSANNPILLCVAFQAQSALDALLLYMLCG